MEERPANLQRLPGRGLSGRKVQEARFILFWVFLLLPLTQQTGLEEQNKQVPEEITAKPPELFSTTEPREQGKRCLSHTSVACSRSPRFKSHGLKSQPRDTSAHYLSVSLLLLQQVAGHTQNDSYLRHLSINSGNKHCVSSHISMSVTEEKESGSPWPGLCTASRGQVRNTFPSPA